MSFGFSSGRVRSAAVSIRVPLPFRAVPPQAQQQVLNPLP